MPAWEGAKSYCNSIHIKDLNAVITQKFTSISDKLINELKGHKYYTGMKRENAHPAASQTKPTRNHEVAGSIPGLAPWRCYGSGVGWKLWLQLDP